MACAGEARGPERSGGIEELGFDTVDAGGLDDSWRQQPDTPVYGLREDVAGVTKALAEASPVRKEAFRG